MLGGIDTHTAYHFHMSLDKSIFYKKEKRKPYRDSKRFDYSCRNHGSCGYCKNNRTHNFQKRCLFSKQDIKDWEIN